MEKWQKQSMGPMGGKTVVITGAHAPLGAEVARELAQHKARLILLSDHGIELEEVVQDLRESVSGAWISAHKVDFSEPEELQEVMEKIKEETEEIYGLVLLHNTGQVRSRHLNSKGQEITFAVNYLASFILVKELFPWMIHYPDARIVFQSDLVITSGTLDLYNVNGEHVYHPEVVYRQSLLANLIFARELDRRIRETHLNVRAIPIHGGSFISKLSRMMGFVPEGGVKKAALPILYAITGENALGGHFYGPYGFSPLKGYVMEADFATEAKNLQVAEALWKISEKLTEREFDLSQMSNVLPLKSKEKRPPEFFI